MTDVFIKYSTKCVTLWTQWPTTTPSLAAWEPTFQTLTTSRLNLRIAMGIIIQSFSPLGHPLVNYKFLLSPERFSTTSRWLTILPEVYQDVSWLAVRFASLSFSQLSIEPSTMLLSACLGVQQSTWPNLQLPSRIENEGEDSQGILWLSRNIPTYFWLPPCMANC